MATPVQCFSFLRNGVSWSSFVVLSNKSSSHCLFEQYVCTAARVAAAAAAATTTQQHHHHHHH
jgi:hypothetical protein